MWQYFEGICGLQEEERLSANEAGAARNGYFFHSLSACRSSLLTLFSWTEAKASGKCKTWTL